MNNPKLKTGFLSSEFYLVLGQSIVGIFVMLGYLTPQQADDFLKAVVSVIGGLMVIVSTVVYLYGRIVLKKEQLQNSTPKEEPPATSVLDNPSLGSDSAPVIPQ